MARSKNKKRSKKSETDILTEMAYDTITKDFGAFKNAGRALDPIFVGLLGWADDPSAALDMDLKLLFPLLASRGMSEDITPLLVGKGKDIRFDDYIKSLMVGRKKMLTDKSSVLKYEATDPFTRAFWTARDKEKRKVKIAK